MAENAISHLSSLALVAFNRVLTTNLTPAFGVPQAQQDALSTRNGLLESLNADVEIARALYRQTVADRENARKGAADAAAQVARTVYANPAVTPGMIVGLGLQPRSTARTRVVPVTPLKLTATPQNTGAVLLEWDRNGNAPGVNFLVEAKLGAGEWALAQDTTATRILLTGFAAGAPVVFRVSASKNKTTSEPSADVSPWERPVRSELRAA